MIFLDTLNLLFKRNELKLFNVSFINSVVISKNYNDFRQNGDFKTGGRGTFDQFSLQKS